MTHSTLDRLRVAVAIPTYRREDVLVQTLTQVLRQTPAADEVIVVDQTPEHELATTEYLLAHSASGHLRWLRQETPNLPKARNRALAETTCDVVIFIDDDVVLAPGFVGAHLANYADAAVAAVAGRVQQAKGWPNRGTRKSWPRELDYLYFRLDGDRRVDGIAAFVGCNHSVRRRVMIALGGYDENFIGWAYREDSDAALRLWKAGGVVLFDPTAKLLHLASPLGGCRLGERQWRLPEWSISYPASYFALKHQFPRPRFWRDVIVLNVRRYALRRDNMFRPWRVPWALSHYAYGLWRASAAARGRR